MPNFQFINNNFRGQFPLPSDLTRINTDEAVRLFEKISSRPEDGGVLLAARDSAHQFALHGNDASENYSRYRGIAKNPEQLAQMLIEHSQQYPHCNFFMQTRAMKKNVPDSLVGKFVPITDVDDHELSICTQQTRYLAMCVASYAQVEPLKDEDPQHIADVVKLFGLRLATYITDLDENIDFSIVNGDNFYFILIDKASLTPEKAMKLAGSTDDDSTVGQMIDLIWTPDDPQGLWTQILRDLAMQAVHPILAQFFFAGFSGDAFIPVPGTPIWGMPAIEKMTREKAEELFRVHMYSKDQMQPVKVMGEAAKLYQRTQKLIEKADAMARAEIQCRVETFGETAVMQNPEILIDAEKLWRLMKKKDAITKG